MERAVFYDASGQRQKWSLRIVGLLLALIIAAAIGFARTVIAVPVPRPIYPLAERSQARPVAAQVAALRRNLGM